MFGNIGKGVKVGSTFEMGFRRRCLGSLGLSLVGLMRGTVVERGVRNGFIFVFLFDLDAVVFKG